MHEVRNNPEKRRFEMDLPEGTAFANYIERDGVFIVTHTETPRAIRGRGFGAIFVRGMLDLISAEKRTITPMCSFVADYMRRHPDTQELIAR
ncbi:MAG: GNAT family N-acetyltransferase [Beijerinckiaceae bacterium]